MVTHLSKINKRVRISSVFLMAFSAVYIDAAGQNLADPTRPPVIAEPAPQGAEVVTPVAGPELQSVLISPTRRVAIISGQSVKLGDKFGEARVVKITENEVVLRNGKDVQVLKLFPGVQKNTAGRAENSADSQKK